MEMLAVQNAEYVLTFGPVRSWEMIRQCCCKTLDMSFSSGDAMAVAGSAVGGAAFKVARSVWYWHLTSQKSTSNAPLIVGRVIPSPLVTVSVLTQILRAASVFVHESSMSRI